MNLLLKFLVKVYMVLSSICLILFVYFVKEDMFLIDVFGCKVVTSCLVYIFAIIIMALFVLFLTKFNSSGKIEKGIKSIELANDSFLPSYLGYFFVGLSVPSDYALAFVLSVLLLFLLSSNVHYFNPCFLLFGFNFYHIETSKNTKIFLITRKKLQNAANVEFDNLKRINDFTFIDVGRKT